MCVPIVVEGTSLGLGGAKEERGEDQECTVIIKEGRKKGNLITTAVM